MSTVTVMQAYRFALDPNAAQARDLERHAGGPGSRSTGRSRR
jgi:hypothetical protein